MAYGVGERRGQSRTDWARDHGLVTSGWVLGTSCVGGAALLLWAWGELPGSPHRFGRHEQAVFSSWGKKPQTGGLKGQKFILSPSGTRSPESRCRQGHPHPEGPRGGSFLPLPAPDSCRTHPGVRQHLPPQSLPRPSVRWRPNPLLLLRTPVVELGPPALLCGLI